MQSILKGGSSRFDCGTLPQEGALPGNPPELAHRRRRVFYRKVEGEERGERGEEREEVTFSSPSIDTESPTTTFNSKGCGLGTRLDPLRAFFFVSIGSAAPTVSTCDVPGVCLASSVTLAADGSG